MRNISAYVVAAILLVGCHGEQKMLTTAPAFGSTAKLSTSEGFLQGRWRENWDSTRARSGNALITSLGNGLAPTLEFLPAGKYRFSYGGADVNGTWSGVSNGIELVPHDVDGEDLEHVKASYEKYLHSSRFSRRFLPHHWWMRGSALERASNTKRLVLSDDKTRLVESVFAERQDRQPLFAEVTWVRLKG